MKMSYKIFETSMFILHAIYLLVFLGILSTVPKYIYFWNYFVQLGLCIFLMFRYHPFRKVYKFEKDDEKIIFSVAILLFINLVSFPLVLQYVESIKNKVVSYTDELKSL